MRLPHLTLALLALFMAHPSAHAKGKKDARSSGTYGCAKFDVNENGVLDPAEKKALLKAFAEGDTALKALDINNDGQLDEGELAKIQLPAPEKKKKKGKG